MSISQERSHLLFREVVPSLCPAGNLGQHGKVDIISEQYRNLFGDLLYMTKCFLGFVWGFFLGRQECLNGHLAVGVMLMWSRGGKNER